MKNLHEGAEGYTKAHEGRKVQKNHKGHEEHEGMKNLHG
jgi:hypothetical protein